MNAAPLCHQRNTIVANATLVWRCLALMLPRNARGRLHAIWAAAWLAVGASRVMLGVHWPSDVIGGWAFGLFWLLLWLRIAGQLLEKERQSVLPKDDR